MATALMSLDDPLVAAYLRVRAGTLALAASLTDADATVQSMPDASPAKWHLAHTSWFFETFVLRESVAGYRPFDPAFAYLFNSYYEAEGRRHARDRRGMLTRPSLAEVRAYRAHVDAAVVAALPDLDAQARERVTLGLAHEAQHAELLVTDILHLFAQNPLAPALRPGTPAPYPARRQSDWVDGRRGAVEVGHDGGGFAFDCEAPRHTSWLAPHRIDDTLVGNAGWQAFVDDGGYRRSELWLSDGWAWVAAEAIDAPLYWRGPDAFGVHGLHLRDPNAPVCHVGFYEADAYARWAGARLPTEFEWEASAPMLDDAFGERWQWTASAFLPYPGFRASPGAIGEYNGKFMSGQMVLRGASCATPAGSATATTRNFFPPTARWQFTGVRLARDL